MSPKKKKYLQTITKTPVSKVSMPKDLRQLKKMEPLKIWYPYQVNYIHSYGQDSPFFAGLANKKLLGTRCKKCRTTYATPRLHCMDCGQECDWVELPQEGRVHTWTTCYFGSEEFLKETPFHLVLVELPGANTLFLSRLVGAKEGKIKIGMKVKAKFKKPSQLKASDIYFVPA